MLKLGNGVLSIENQFCGRYRGVIRKVMGKFTGKVTGKVMGKKASKSAVEVSKPAAKVANKEIRKASVPVAPSLATRAVAGNGGNSTAAPSQPVKTVEASFKSNSAKPEVARPVSGKAVPGGQSVVKPAAKKPGAGGAAKQAGSGGQPVGSAGAAGAELAQIKVRAKLDPRVWRATAEVLWADPLPKRSGFAKLDSIPVFASGFAFGDLVMTDHSVDHFIQEVVERSGHSTFRLKFLEPWPDEETLGEFWKRYQAIGCTFTAMKSLMLMAMCSPPGIDSRKVLDMLNKDQANYDFECEATYLHPYR